MESKYQKSRAIEQSRKANLFKPFDISIEINDTLQSCLDRK